MSKKIFMLFAFLVVSQPMFGADVIDSAQFLWGEDVGMVSRDEKTGRGPESFTCDGKGVFYIADTYNNRILMSYDSGYKEFASLDGQPLDIALDRDNNLWIYEVDKSRIICLAQDGSMIRTVNVRDYIAGPAELTVHNLDDFERVALDTGRWVYLFLMDGKFFAKYRKALSVVSTNGVVWAQNLSEENRYVDLKKNPEPIELTLKNNMKGYLVRNTVYCRGSFWGSMGIIRDKLRIESFDGSGKIISQERFDVGDDSILPFSPISTDSSLHSVYVMIWETDVVTIMRISP